MVSNALDKSRKTPIVLCDLSSDWVILSIRSTTANCVQKFAPKPYCASFRISKALRNEFRRSATNLSKIFEKQVVFQIIF